MAGGRFRVDNSCFPGHHPLRFSRIKEATSRLWHLEKFCPNFSNLSFVIRANLPESILVPLGLLFPLRRLLPSVTIVFFIYLFRFEEENHENSKECGIMLWVYGLS